MPFYIYILKSKSSGTSYVGSTNNLQKRLTEHNNGRSLATKSKRPWKLVYKEEFRTRSEAAKRERFFKSVEGRIELRNRGSI